MFYHFFKKILFISAILFVLGVPLNSSAQSNIEEISSFKSQITINTDSSTQVNEEISYNFPIAKHGINRTIPYRYKDNSNGKYFETPIENLQITLDGQSVPYSESNNGNYLNLKIGDANKTIEGTHNYKISYTVSGVLNYFQDHDELYWNVTGNDWTVPIQNVQAIVHLSSAVQGSSVIKTCYTGATGSKEQDCSSDVNGTLVNFFAADGPLTIVTGWNKGAVTPVARQYEVSWRHESSWYWLLPLFVLILLFYLYFKNGRDPAGRGTIAPEFEPPENLLPAQMGALIDEKADSNDISATIIDLAVRGFLKIREEKSGIFGAKKYTLIKLKEANAKLNSYEKDILEGVFDTDKEVELKTVYETFAQKLPDIKKDIYQDLVTKKYFIENPDKPRLRYHIAGFVVIFIAAIFTPVSWNLVFAFGLSGILILIFARFMPKKTREGVIAKEKSLGFKEFLFRAERYRIKWQEKQNIFEHYLPYAMVFGIAEIWAKNFKDLYKNPPDWYEGNFTTFNAVVFASSLTSFSDTAMSSFSPPAASGSSGFGGGGSSGGGFGGGGGGSW